MLKTLALCAFVLGSLSLPVSAATPTVDVPLHGNGKFTETPRGRIYYETEGAGPAVVLVAGGPGSSHASFHPWFSRLKANHQVIYFDNIGRGRSDRARDGAYSVASDVADIEALRSALGLDTISLIGHSYGGIPALAYAIAHPEHVHRLVLSSAMVDAQSFQMNIDSANQLASTQFPEIWTKLMALRQRGIKSGATEYENLYGQAEGDLYWSDPANIAKLWSSGDPRDGLNFAVYESILGDDPEWTVGGSLKGYTQLAAAAHLRVPVLITSGRFDRVATPAVAARTAAALPSDSTRLVVFEHSGHRPWIEEADAWFKLVSEFLE
jgi:proline iminopeptidase